MSSMQLIRIYNRKTHHKDFNLTGDNVAQPSHPQHHGVTPYTDFIITATTPLADIFCRQNT